MSYHGIHNRLELAQQLRQHGINKTTVYRAFDEDWSGHVTTTVLAALAYTFRVPIGFIVAEPAEVRR